MKVVDRNIDIGAYPKLLGDTKNVTLNLVEKKDGISIFRLSLTSHKNKGIAQVTWSIPAIDIRGSWSPGLVLDKRFRADWEVPQLESCISVNAPILSLMGHHDDNKLTFSCDDTVNSLDFEAGLREEDNRIYCSIYFDFEKIMVDADYSALIYLDWRKKQFSKIIQETAHWLEKNTALQPCPTPYHSKVPLYSTWYSYHQDIDTKSLLNECRLSKELGYELIIIDDGWQTMDNQRGYDYTGDWNPDRIPDMAKFVKDVHKTGMKIMLWYSVPFCGVKSEAYQKFKGKFLTENHHWAPVFDPRFPEVREYLVNKYKNALIDWNIDGFKLDFIDDFKIYPETELTATNGRDFSSVNMGVQALIMDIRQMLNKVKPDALIEFRQKYINPVLRHLGNMFRAFDCPNDSHLNRIRTTDVKLLCGKSAVHSDMFTWHKNETVEMAALQITAILFSVPQLSLKLDEITDDYKEMIRFFTQYWNKNKGILLDGDFTAYKPLSAYPILKAENNDKIIYALYDDGILEIDHLQGRDFDIINGKLTQNIILDYKDQDTKINIIIFNCKGEEVDNKSMDFTKGIHVLQAPKNGLLKIKSLTK